jgi:hypothetical protein
MKDLTPRAYTGVGQLQVIRCVSFRNNLKLGEMRSGGNIRSLNNEGDKLASGGDIHLSHDILQVVLGRIFTDK